MYTDEAVLNVALFPSVTFLTFNPSEALFWVMTTTCCNRFVWQRNFFTVDCGPVALRVGDAWTSGRAEWAPFQRFHQVRSARWWKETSFNPQNLSGRNEGNLLPIVNDNGLIISAPHFTQEDPKCFTGLQIASPTLSVGIRWSKLGTRPLLGALSSYFLKCVKICMYILMYVCVCECVHVWSLQLCLTLCNPMDCSLHGFTVHGINPGKNTGVGCHSPSRGPSWPKDWICISCNSYITGQFFTTESPGKPLCVYLYVNISMYMSNYKT